MAWSAVSSAVTTIGKLLGEEAVYLWGVKEQVDRLQTELKWMRSSLMEADVKQHEDKRIRLLVAEIRELAYDVEDVIQDFALRVQKERWFFGLSQKIRLHLGRGMGAPRNLVKD
ncbi:hypothetical protein V6N11_080351 [Hibiscus sabdariffa]|uniref:Disease resistance N-terminal domain-containing protein n=1 Tax=Hibiscus sabdariffa TaxID=183260 RepID=A0ABR2R7W8_9ROSI